MEAASYIFNRHTLHVTPNRITSASTTQIPPLVQDVVRFMHEHEVKSMVVDDTFVYRAPTQVD